MLKNTSFKWMLGMACLCLVAALSSCGTSRKMGCPMQFSQNSVPAEPVSLNLHVYASHHSSC